MARGWGCVPHVWLCRIRGRQSPLGCLLCQPDLVSLIPVHTPLGERLSFSTEPLMTKSLVRYRATAYIRQSGRCFYCGLPMWIGNPREFALRHNITLAQAMRFQCTAEHLEARQDGGSDSAFNIVAACRHCNQNRHRRKKAPSPDRYKELVRRRMNTGRWHDYWVLQRRVELRDAQKGARRLRTDVSPRRR